MMETSFTSFYTMPLVDAIEILEDAGTPLYEDWEWDSSVHLEKLKAMILAKFYNWEIAGETLQEFKLFMYYKFEEYKDYYAERLNAYETEINFLDGDKTTYDLTTTTDMTKTDTPRAKFLTERYDLPRSASSDSRPSEKAINGGESGVNTSEDEGTVAQTGTLKKGNPLELKKEYLDLIQNMYDQFAQKFRVCFIDMFS